MGTGVDSKLFCSPSGICAGVGAVCLGSQGCYPGSYFRRFGDERLLMRRRRDEVSFDVPPVRGSLGTHENDESDSVVKGIESRVYMSLSSNQSLRISHAH